MSQNMPVSKNAGLARFAVRCIVPTIRSPFVSRVADARLSIVHPLSAEEDQVSFNQYMFLPRLLIVKKQDAQEGFLNVQHAALGPVNVSITGKIQSRNLTRIVPCMSLQMGFQSWTWV